MWKTPEQLVKQNNDRFQRRVDFDPVGPKEGHWMWNSTVFKRRKTPLSKVKEQPWFWIATNDASQPNKSREVKVYARRYAWEMLHGPLGPGMAVRNVCGWDRCVNPNLKHNRPVRIGDWNRKDPPISYSLEDLQRMSRGLPKKTELPRVLSEGELAAEQAGKRKRRGIPTEEEFLDTEKEE